MLDEYLYGSVNRVSPEAPVPVFDYEGSKNFLGGAANVASNLSTLGSQVGLLSLTGNDETFEILKNELLKKDIKNYLISDKKIKTIKKTRIVTGGHQLLRLDKELDFNLKEKNYVDLKNKYKEIILSYDVVIISDYNKGVLKEVKDLISIGKSESKIIVVDPKGDCFEKYFGADMITPNLKEFTNVVGAFDGENELIKKGIKLKESYQFKNILITRSEKGMTLINSNNDVSNYLASEKTVYDVTGAGDTVIASLAACLSTQMSIEDSVKISNIAAGIVVSKSGTSSVTIEELNKSESNIFNSSNLDILKKIIGTNSNKIVFTNGCFDILHPGHIKSLRQAADLGDILIVGLNSDNSVKRLKGSNRPVNNENTRSEVLSNLSFVDYVIIFEDDNPLSIIEAIKPNIIAKGGDYKKEEVVGSNFVESYGGKVELLDFVEGYSSSDIISKIQKGDKGK